MQKPSQEGFCIAIQIKNVRLILHTSCSSVITFDFGLSLGNLDLHQ